MFVAWANETYTKEKKRFGKLRISEQRVRRLTKNREAEEFPATRLVTVQSNPLQTRCLSLLVAASRCLSLPLAAPDAPGPRFPPQSSNDDNDEVDNDDNEDEDNSHDDHEDEDEDEHEHHHHLNLNLPIDS